MQVDVRAPQTWQDQRLAAVHQVAAVELGTDLHGQCALLQGRVALWAVWRGLGEVAAQADKHLAVASEHGIDGLHCVVARRAWHLELKMLFQGIEKCGRRVFVDAHGAVALDIAVAAHGAQAGTGLAHVAAQEH